MHSNIHIAYGRVSTDSQEKEKLAQYSKVTWNLTPRSHEFGLDVWTGDSDPFDRPMFPDQYQRAQSLGVPLIVEHPDPTMRARALFQDAGQAIRRAKQAGGNRVEIVDAEPGDQGSTRGREQA